MTTEEAINRRIFRHRDMDVPARGLLQIFRDATSTLTECARGLRSNSTEALVKSPIAASSLIPSPAAANRPSIIFTGGSISIRASYGRTPTRPQRYTLPTSSHAHEPKTPPILAYAGPLLTRYDVIFCDVWGVVHNGVTAFQGACRALAKFRSGGGTVILVSNAPVPKQRVADMLDSRHVPTSAWDDIVSSGDIALGHV